MVGLCGALVINVGFWTRGVWRGLVRDPLWKTQQPPAQGDVTAHL